MPAYRCYCLDLAGHIAAPGRNRECGDDLEARMWARDILAADSHLPAVDLWCGQRYVGRVPQPVMVLEGIAGGSG